MVLRFSALPYQGVTAFKGCVVRLMRHCCNKQARVGTFSSPDCVDFSCMSPALLADARCKVACCQFRPGGTGATPEGNLGSSWSMRLAVSPSHWRSSWAVQMARVSRDFGTVTDNTCIGMKTPSRRDMVWHVSGQLPWSLAEKKIENTLFNEMLPH